MHSCITWHCWWFPVFNPNGLIVFDLEFHSDSWFLRLASSIEYDLFCIWTVHTVASAIWGTQCLGANTLMLAWLLPCLTNCTLALLRLRVFEFRWFPTSITNTEVMGPLTVAASWSRMTIPFDIIFLDANKKKHECFAKYLCAFGHWSQWYIETMRDSDDSRHMKIFDFPLIPPHALKSRETSWLLHGWKLRIFFYGETARVSWLLNSQNTVWSDFHSLRSSFGTFQGNTGIVICSRQRSELFLCIEKKPLHVNNYRSFSRHISMRTYL